MKSVSKSLLTMLTAAGLALTAAAEPSYKAELTVSKYAGSASLANFPVLVRISPETISGFAYSDCDPDGLDLSFVDETEAPLDFEIDTWNPDGESLVWVRLPSLANAVTFTMRWGDPAPVAYTPSATWNANYGMVWHMGEASGTCANSTSYGSAYDAEPMKTPVNSFRYTGTDAPVGFARTTATSAANSYLSVPNYDALGFGSTFTMSGWVRLSGCTAYPRLFSRKKSYTDANGWEIEMSSGSYTAFGARGSNNPSYAGSFASPGLKETWTHVALVYDGTTLTVYGNGVAVKTGTINAATDNGFPLSIGCDSDGNETIAQGAYDECRLMGEAATADWVAAEYATVADTAFLTYGEAEATVIDPTLALGTPRVRSADYNSAAIMVPLRGLGEGATLAGMKFVYGETADQLASEQAVGVVTQTCSAVFTLNRLYPGHTYYAKVVATNDLAAAVESDLFEITTPVLQETSGYPGLNQTFFTSANANWDKDYSNIPAGTDWLNYTDADRIYRRELGTLAAYIGGNPKANPRTSVVWGDSVYWPVNGGQWVYWGTMYMDATKTYKFRMKIDDNERVKVTDIGTGRATVLLNDIGNGSAIVTSSAFTPSVTGWHEIEIRMSDGSGGAGGYTTTDGYLNTENMGWSDDNGATWKLMMDPGDGSLLRTEGKSVIKVKENVVAGVLKTVMLSFDAGTAPRALWVAYGSTYGGNEVADWDATMQVTTVGANATSYTYTVPATWGTDDNLVMRFYFLDNGFAAWSDSVFWRDFTAPALDGLTLDGRGGDTLVVKGNLVSVGGTNCRLSVLVGTNANDLATVWEALPGSMRSTAGAFSFTLFDGDPESAAYLAPGGTYYVCVEAVAGGKTARSGTAKVEMSRQATFAASSSAVARRTVTFTGTLSDLGMAGQPDMTLWVGSSANEDALTRSGAPVAVTADGSFTFTRTFDAFDTTYYWQIRAANVSAGGTATAEARTAVASFKTLDTTTYTWAGGASGDWSDAANWSNNQSGDCRGYPQTSAATVVFPAGTKATVRFTEPLAIGALNLNNAGVDVTFTQGGASTNATKLTASSINVNGANGRLTLDNVALYTPGATLGSQYVLVLTNAANWHVNGDFWGDNYGSVRLYADSWLSCNQFGLGGGDSVISDSTLWTRSHDIPGRSKAGGSIRFEGTHPLWWHNNNGGYFYSALAAAGYRLEFVVPVGGFAAAPIRAIANQSYYMGNNGNNAGSAAISVNVLDESPANRVDATITSPLISWPKGINKTMIVEGTLPDDGPGTDDAFVWSDEDYPLTLGVRIAGSTHADALTISGWPEAIRSPEISPAYGEHAVSLGGTRVCSAPMGGVTISDDKRATCTGWKLYTVNPMTHERTLEDSGEGASYTFTNDDGLWHELEWQWKVEYRISVTSAGNGTAAADEQWVETGKKAHVTQTPAAGYGFGKWTGDVPADRNKSMELNFTVRDRAYSFEASFLPVIYVDALGGNDANGGTSWADALATIPAALAKNANGYILLADGTYEVTAQIALTGGATIAGANPGAKAVVKCMTKLSDNTGAPSSVFKLAHDDARLYNITITTDYDKNDSSKNDYGTAHNGDFARGVWLDGKGLVDSCVITNCRSIYCNGDGGGGVFLNNGGIVRNSILTHNTTYASGGNNAHGHNAIIKTAGLIESCVLTWGAVGKNDSSSAGVSLRGANAILRNSLIAHNTQGHDNVDGATGVKLEPGIMENCTVAENFHGVSTQTKGVYVYTSGSIIRNCVIWNNRNTGGIANWDVRANTAYTVTRTCSTPLLPGVGNVATDPAFVNGSADDFRLGLSGAVDAAEYLDWMDWVGDLDGNDRIQGAAPDMGCYEFTAAALSCGFDVEAAGQLGTDTVTLKARVMGEDLEGLTYTWTITDMNGGQTVRSGADLATLVLEMPIGTYSVSLAVENGAGVTANLARPEAFSVSPADIYVDLDGAGVYPYDSYANGATTLEAALAAATHGSVIHVNDGWHVLADTLAVSKGVTFVSENGPDVTFIFGRALTSGAPVILVNHDDAVFSGFTLSGTDQNGVQPEQWSGLRMTGGTVTNCFVCNHKTMNNASHGAGCRLEGGTIVDCIFSNNYTKCSGGAGHNGGAIYQTGANTLVDRCIIADNQVADGGTSYGGGVYLNAGVIRNSFIVGNVCVNYGGGLAVEGTGKALNCTVVNNQAGTASGGIWKHATNGTVTDCLAYNNTANNMPEDVDDPGFEDAANGNFHLSVASAAVDAAAGVGLGDFDLELNPRVSGAAADKGCYERDVNQFSVGIAYRKLTDFAPGPVEFTAIATGAELDPGLCWWTFDGTEPGPNNYAKAGTVVTNTFSYGTVTVRFKAVNGNDTYPIDRPDWFTMFGRTVYLVTESANPVYPYATPETATADYAEAFLALQEGATLLIGDGTYTIPAERIIESRVTIRSANGPSKTILDCHDAVRAFTLANPGAVLSGVTIARAKGWQTGGGVQLKNGATVTNCVFDACRCQNVPAGAVYMEGGATLVDCLITNCSSYYSASHNGVGVYANGKALIDRCIVVDCHEGYQNGKTVNTVGDGAVYLAETGGNCGTVRNTVVAGSALQGCGGIVVGKNGVVENCTVVGNTSTNVAETVAGIKILNTGARVVNTLVYGNTWGGRSIDVGGVSGYEDCFDHCLVGQDPKLRGAGACPFEISSASPCKDAGKSLAWMDAATDLYGRPRLFGGAPDIGASECNASSATLLIFR